MIKLLVGCRLGRKRMFQIARPRLIGNPQVMQAQGLFVILLSLRMTTKCVAEMELSEWVLQRASIL